MCGFDSEKDEPPEPVIPDHTMYLIAGFVLCLVVGSLVFMAYVMIAESGAHNLSLIRDPFKDVVRHQLLLVGNDAKEMGMLN